jgi:molecular chaperone HtpG
VVTVTVRRMVISRHVRGLLPAWASFLRGVLELNGCAPTASREDLVRDGNFEAACSTLENLLFEHFEKLAKADLPRFEAVINWHRYTLAGAALTNRRLRDLMRRTYPFASSQGTVTFDQILDKSLADPLFESEAGHVIWYNVDRRQERWANALFAGHDAPCVHALRSFEESLLAAMAADAEADHKTQGPVSLRPASPGSPSFAKTILGVSDMEEADAAWQEFLAPAGAKVFTAKFDSKQPVMAFLNEKHELMRTFDELKKRGDIPAGFQRLIDNHFRDNRPDRNEVLLNRGHRLVARALSQKTSHPLASVLRLLVMNALTAAGAPLAAGAQSQQAEDLDWIAETLWGK